MSTEPAQPPAPTPEELEQMTAIAAAGDGAVQAGEDPAQAMKDKRDEVGFVKLDDETIDKLADVLSDKSIEKLDLRGAFALAPEPVKPPEQPVAPPTPGEQAPAEPAPAGPAPKRTFADRFLNG